MIDDKTPNLNLPLPASTNRLADDVERLRDAFSALDGAVSGKAPAAHGHAIDDVSGLAAALLAKVEATALAAVAFSGAYSDLTGKPDGNFSGSYNDLTDKPTLFSGAYVDLSGKPTIPTAVSQLLNDLNFVAASALSNYLLSSTAASTYATKANPAFTGVADFQGAVQTGVVGVVASNIDCSAGNYFTKTAPGALTWTFSNTPGNRAYSFVLELTNGGLGAQTWPTSVKWPGGVAPELAASGVDLLGFIIDDGATWRGVHLMKDSK